MKVAKIFFYLYFGSFCLAGFIAAIGMILNKKWHGVCVRVLNIGFLFGAMMILCLMIAGVIALLLRFVCY